jgi:hypothetical protein
MFRKEFISKLLGMHTVWQWKYKTSSEDVRTGMHTYSENINILPVGGRTYYYYSVKNLTIKPSQAAARYVTTTIFY